MKIQIEVPDVENAAKALNNATLAYSVIINQIILGVYVGRTFEPLYNRTEDELRGQINLLKDVLQQLDEINEKGVQS